MNKENNIGDETNFNSPLGVRGSYRDHTGKLWQ